MTSYHYLTLDALVEERFDTYLADGEAARLAKDARQSRQRAEETATTVVPRRAVLRRLIPRWR
jgi:hypothetical protein